MMVTSANVTHHTLFTSNRPSADGFSKSLAPVWTPIVSVEYRAFFVDETVSRRQLYSIRMARDSLHLSVQHIL